MTFLLRTKTCPNIPDVFSPLLSFRRAHYTCARKYVWLARLAMVAEKGIPAHRQYGARLPPARRAPIARLSRACRALVARHARQGPDRYQTCNIIITRQMQSINGTSLKECCTVRLKNSFEDVFIVLNHEVIKKY